MLLQLSINRWRLAPNAIPCLKDGNDPIPQQCKNYIEKQEKLKKLKEADKEAEANTADPDKVKNEATAKEEITIEEQFKNEAYFEAEPEEEMPPYAYEDDPENGLIGMEEILSIFKKQSRAPWTYDEDDKLFYFYRMTRRHNGIPPLCHDLIIIDKYEGTLTVESLGEVIPARPFSPQDYDDETDFIKRTRESVHGFIHALKKRRQVPNDNPKEIVKYAHLLLALLLKTGHEGIPTRKLEFLTDQIDHLHQFRAMDSALLKLASSLRTISPEAYDMLRNEDIMTIPTYSLLLTIGCPGNREIRKLTNQSTEQKENKKPAKPEAKKKPPTPSTSENLTASATEASKRKRSSGTAGSGNKRKRETVVQAPEVTLAAAPIPEESQNVIQPEPPSLSEQQPPEQQHLVQQQQSQQQVLVPTSAAWYPEFSLQQHQPTQQPQHVAVAAESQMQQPTQHQVQQPTQYSIIMPSAGSGGQTEIRYETAEPQQQQQHVIQQQVQYQIVMPSPMAPSANSAGTVVTQQTPNVVIHNLQTLQQQQQQQQQEQQHTFHFTQQQQTHVVQEPQAVTASSPQKVLVVNPAQTKVVAVKKVGKGKALPPQPTAGTVVAQVEPSAEQAVTFIEQGELEGEAMSAAASDTVEKFVLTSDGLIIKKPPDPPSADAPPPSSASSPPPVLTMRPPKSETLFHPKMMADRRQAIQAGIEEVLNKKSYKPGGSGQKTGKASMKTNEAFLSGNYGKKIKISSGERIKRLTASAAARKQAVAAAKPAAVAAAGGAAAAQKKLVPISFEEMQRVLAAKKQSGPIQLRPANCKILPVPKAD